MLDGLVEMRQSGEFRRVDLQLPAAPIHERFSVFAEAREGRERLREPQGWGPLDQPPSDNRITVVFACKDVLRRCGRLCVSVHLVEDPVLMFNEIERVLKERGHFFIKDLRRSWLSIFEREIKSTYSIKEALVIIDKSELRIGEFSSGFLWWDYEKL